MTLVGYKPRVPVRAIDAVLSGRARRGRIAFDLTKNFKWCTAALESYAFARWKPVVADAMVVAGCIEFADRTFARPKLGWRRDFVIRIPVLEPMRWIEPSVYDSLCDAALFVTGDSWTFEFVKSNCSTVNLKQNFLPLQIRTRAVIAFSDGMDSCPVAALASQKMGQSIVRVRVGRKAAGRPTAGEPVPFAAVPYSVKTSGDSTVRSRGFKFALISGIAAYLAEADEIFLPESGQGVFGPALASVATQAYPDYRSHPRLAFREYAIAGTQHLDYLADLTLPVHRPLLRRHAIMTGVALGQPTEQVGSLLADMLARHAAEWGRFLKNAGSRSFLKQWTRAA